MKKIIITIIILIVLGGGYFLFSEFRPDLENLLSEEEQEEEEERFVWETDPKEVYLQMVEELEKTENIEEYLQVMEEYVSEGSKRGLEQLERMIERSSIEKETFFLVLKEKIPSGGEIEEEISGGYAFLEVIDSMDSSSGEIKRMILEDEEWKFIADGIF